MNQKLMSKSQALASMALGMRVRNTLWDNPYHYGCAYAYIKEGQIWNHNTEANICDAVWLTINEFKTNDRLRDGWYIYELQSS